MTDCPLGNCAFAAQLLEPEDFTYCPECGEKVEACDHETVLTEHRTYCPACGGRV